MSKPELNQIEYTPHATVFVGHDATACFQAFTLASALKLYGEHRIRPNRAVTPTQMLDLATQFTGKHYKRGAYLTAAADVRLWAETMKAALPAVTREGPAPR